MTPRYGPLTMAEIKWIKSLQITKYRKLHRCFIVEGEKLIHEMLSHFPCRLLVGTEPLIQPLLAVYAAQIDCAVLLPSQEQFAKISLQKSPRPLLAVLEQPILPPPEHINTTTLLLDDIQDPGNLGSILRSCDWFGIRQVLATPGCADPYAPKVLQATMGALARVQVHKYDDRAPLLRLVAKHSGAILGTFIEGTPIQQIQVLDHASTIIILGNEGKGIAPDLSALITDRITIPSPNLEHCESLNVSVAGGIIFSHLLG